jgi:hypothetical protein
LGRAALRAGAASPNPLSVPCSICGATDGSEIAIASIVLATAALTAGAPPWKGTWVASTFATILKK